MADAAAVPRAIDYLVVAANEGGSSGGHAAIRFGAETYHYQHEDPGILRLMRVDSGEFATAYSVIENRAIRVSRVAVSAETYDLLRDAFNQSYLEEEQSLSELEALRRERELLGVLAGGSGDEGRAAGLGGVRLPGAGFFVDDAQRGVVRANAVSLRDGPSEPDGPSLVLVRLRARVEAERGPDFLRTRESALRAGLARAFDDYAPTGTAGEVYRDRFTGLVALDVLERAAALRSDAYRAPSDADFALGDDERAWLARFADRLEGDLVALAGSDRPGWSLALLVGMARLIALHQSLESGRLVVLDAFPDSAVRLGPDALARQRELLPGLLEEAEADLATARGFLAHGDGAPLREADWTRVETAANRVLELEGAIAHGHALRLAPGALVPSRPAVRSDLVAPDLPAEVLARDREAARAAESARADQLRERYAYNLLTRNCVTEIFRTIDEAVPSDQSEASLGGRIAPDDLGTFIPILSEGAVRAHYRVVERREIPSYRDSRRAALAERDGAVASWLRERSPLTSEVQRGRGERDSTFLFFTDDAPALRPALGAVNLAVGLGAAAAGVVLAPLDGGRALWGGLRGALFSLPELAFVSLRKGSFDFVPRRAQPDLRALDPLAIPAGST